MSKYHNFRISWTEDYSEPITLEQLKNVNSSYKYISIFHIYNQYAYIKSSAFIGLAYSSVISSINKYYHYHSHNNYVELNDLYNIVFLHNYILMPLTVKVNSKNIFLLTLYDACYYNNMHTSIIYIHNHKIEYTFLSIKKGILYNPHNEFLLSSIKDLILFKYQTINDIINSKLLLNQLN